MIRVPDGFIPDRLPFLQAICWQIQDIHGFSPQEMLHRYEQGWHYRGVLADIDRQEMAFIRSLVKEYGSCLSSMFSDRQHQRIVQILHQLRADFLQECKVYFGGGTLLALMYGEYRQSKDIDFLCSDRQGYRQLREAIFTQQYAALFKETEGLSFPREIRADRYGVRFPIMIDDVSIRLEIVSEGRIELEDPETLEWCPVPCLSLVDRGAEKLLANSDRWMDSSVFSRDLIDLAILAYHGDLYDRSFVKAEAAYPVREPLKRAIAAFRELPDGGDRCYQALQIQNPAQVMEGLEQLKRDF